MYPNPNHTSQLLLTFIFDSRGIRICTYTQSHLSGKSLFHTSVDSLSLWDTLSILFRAWAELQLKCWGFPSSLLFWPLLPLRWKQNNTIPHFHHPHSSLLATLWTEQKWKRTRWRHLRVSGFLEFHFPLSAKLAKPENNIWPEPIWSRFCWAATHWVWGLLCRMVSVSLSLSYIYSQPIEIFAGKQLVIATASFLGIDMPTPQIPLWLKIK